MNLTLTSIPDQINSTLPYQATQKCANWCVEQQLVFYNNLEISAISFVLLALFMLYIAEFCNEHERFKNHSPTFIYMAKVSMYIFFFVFFIVIKLRMYYFYGV